MVSSITSDSVAAPRPGSDVGAVRCGAVRCGAVRCGAVWCDINMEGRHIGHIGSNLSREQPRKDRQQPKRNRVGQSALGIPRAQLPAARCALFSPACAVDYDCCSGKHPARIVGVVIVAARVVTASRTAVAAVAFTVAFAATRRRLPAADCSTVKMQQHQIHCGCQGSNVCTVKGNRVLQAAFVQISEVTFHINNRCTVTVTCVPPWCGRLVQHLLRSMAPFTHPPSFVDSFVLGPKCGNVRHATQLRSQCIARPAAV